MTTEHDVAPSARALRIMALVRWILLALVSVVAVKTVWSYWGPGRAEADPLAEDRYMCPMHPQVRSPEPGVCSICGMDLEPIPDPIDHPVVAPGAEGLPGVAVELTLERAQLIGVTTEAAITQELTPMLRLPATVELPDDARSEVHVRAAGFLDQVDVRERGVHVQAGQVLAWLYSPEILQAQEELIAAAGWGSDVARATRRSLGLLGVSESDIATIVRDKKAMLLVPIRAPADGVVSELAAVVGAYVTPETALYRVFDRSRVWVVARVAERDLPLVQVGLAAAFSPAGRPAELIEGRIDLVEPIFDASTRTAGLRLVLPNAPDTEHALLPGQFGDVTIRLPPTRALVVPRDAVIDTGRWQYVFVDRGEGRFEPRAVQPGRLYGERRAIDSGLSVGERVVVRGSFMLDAESRLQAALSRSRVRGSGGVQAMPGMAAPEAP